LEIRSAASDLLIRQPPCLAWEPRDRLPLVALVKFGGELIIRERVREQRDGERCRVASAVPPLNSARAVVPEVRPPGAGK
jgi:hypothetical protein